MTSARPDQVSAVAHEACVQRLLQGAPGRVVGHGPVMVQRGGEEEPLGDSYVAEHVRHGDGRIAGVHHRTGPVEIGEPSVIIAVSAPHRADALAACKDAIDTLKQTVPLWKKELYEGGEEWVGQGS